MISESAGRVGIIKNDGLAETGSFGQSDRAGNLNGKNVVVEMAANFFADLAGKTFAPVIHSNQSAGDFQGMVKIILNQIDSF